MMSISAGEMRFNRGSVYRTYPHTCITLRREAGTLNEHGELELGDYAPYLTGVRCFIWSPLSGQRGEYVSENRALLRDEYHMTVPPDTDIHEGDVVDNAVNQLGEPLHEGELNVLSLARGDLELLVVMEEVRS